MDIDVSLLDKIKKNLRISHSALDDDLTDTIAACVTDLTVYGVKVTIVDDVIEMDPLILNAIKLYCKAEYTDDPGKAAQYRARYDALKTCMGMAGEYKGAVTDE